MKKNNRFYSSVSYSVFWGLVLVIAAVALVLDGLGVNMGLGLTAFHYIFGAICLGWIIKEIIDLKFHRIFFPLAFMFFIFEGAIAGWMGRTDPNIISNWTVLLAALLLTLGVKAISGKNGSSGKKIGNNTYYFDANDKDKCIVTENLGNVQVHFINKEQYDGLGVVTVRENIGNVTLHIPSEWNVLTEAKENLGKVNIPSRETLGEKSITISIRENLGQINVVFE